MKSLSQIKFEVHKGEKRIDKEILDIKLHESVVCFVDEESRVQWASFPDEVEVYGE